MKNKNLDLIVYKKGDFVVAKNNSKDDIVYDVYHLNYFAKNHPSFKLLNDAIAYIQKTLETFYTMRGWGISE